MRLYASIDKSLIFAAIFKINYIWREKSMVKRTYRNFIRTMEILQNQCYMTAADAERKTRQIFDSVEYDRKYRKVKSTVEDYLTAEINIANNALN